MSTENEPKSSYFLLILYIIFFISGACALIYEVVWTRRLTLIFGSSVLAISTVLACFMAGLAIGSFYFGRWIDRQKQRNPILIYGILEFLIGLYALITPVLFKLIEASYVYWYESLFTSWSALALVRFFLSAIILIPPCILMGATLPVLAKFLVSKESFIGSKVSLLYALNTFGAAVGTFLAGFIIIQSIGVKNTIYSAAVINILIGLTAFFLSRSKDILPTTISVKLPAGAPINNTNFGDTGNCYQAGKISFNYNLIVLITVASGGLASMAYEITWSRVLVLFLGSSIYAFSTMLVSFILGIALGSLIFFRYFKKQAKLIYLGRIQAGIGFAALIVIPVFNYMPFWFLKLFNISSNYFWVMGIEFYFCFLVMLIPTVLMGLSFPLAVQLYYQGGRESVKKILPGQMDSVPPLVGAEQFPVESGTVGVTVGRVYFWNTVGCVLGSLLTGFIAIPYLGVESSMYGAVLINLIIALVIFWMTTRASQRKWLLFLFSGFVVISFLISPSWNRLVLTGGASRHDVGAANAADNFETNIKTREIVYYGEGLNSTITVRRNGPEKILEANGKHEASNFPQDMTTQLLVGYLPLFIHKEPKRILVIGLGSGITLGAAASTGVEVDCCEIEAKVVEAARFFAEENHNVLANPNVNIIINDARTHLLGTRKKYDIIISEPPHLWTAGVSNLFTQDFYRICRNALAENGVMCQWFHNYGISSKDVNMILATFSSIFPHPTLWHSFPGDNFLIATPERFTWSAAPKIQELMATYPLIHQDVQKLLTFRAGFKYFSFAGTGGFFKNFFTLDEDEIKEIAFEEQINTDDFPRLEFSVPKNIYARQKVMQKNESKVLGAIMKISVGIRDKKEKTDILQELQAINKPGG
ncbi:MAG: fused MFS/spermidine synthase, partial [Planctomycetota bacterium]